MSLALPVVLESKEWAALRVSIPLIETLGVSGSSEVLPRVVIPTGKWTLSYLGITCGDLFSKEQ